MSMCHICDTYVTIWAWPQAIANSCLTPTGKQGAGPMAGLEEAPEIKTNRMKEAEDSALKQVDSAQSPLTLESTVS